MSFIGLSGTVSGAAPVCSRAEVSGRHPPMPGGNERVFGRWLAVMGVGCLMLLISVDCFSDKTSGNRSWQWNTTPFISLTGTFL